MDNKAIFQLTDAFTACVTHKSFLKSQLNPVLR